MGGLAVIALVALVIYGAQERKQWYRDREAALTAARAASDSVQTVLLAKLTADSIIAVAQQAKARADSAARASDQRRGALERRNVELRRELAALDSMSTPADSVVVLLRLVAGLEAQGEEAERRIAADSVARIALDRQTVEFQQGRDRALALVEQQQRVIDQQTETLATAEPRCRGCPSRKTSYTLGFLSGAGSVLAAIVLIR